MTGVECFKQNTAGGGDGKINEGREKYIMCVCKHIPIHIHIHIHT